MHITLIQNEIRLIQLKQENLYKSYDNLFHSSWLGVSQSQDATETIEALSGNICDWLIVDHYALDKRWENNIRSICNKLMVIDDLADRAHDCDILLDQNYHLNMNTRYNKLNTDCELLLGPSYALLRNEFSFFRKKSFVRNGIIKRLLIFFGGIDAENCTSLAIEAISELDLDIAVDVVIGKHNPFKEQVKNACRRYKYNCHIQTMRIAELMSSADLAIGGAGTSSLERCSLGLPAVIISIANNQIELARSLHSIGASFYLGSSENISKENLKKIIKDLYQSPHQVNRASIAAYSLVDGLGAKRVCRSMGI